MSAASAVNEYARIVIWGLRRWRDGNTHRYVHRGFDEAARRLHRDVVWVDDRPENAAAVVKGALVVTGGMCCRNLPIIEGASYVLHNADEAVKSVRNRAHWIILQVWTAPVAERSGEYYDPVTRFDSENRVLYQPWGTNVAEHSFGSPVDPGVRNRFLSAFIGTVWNNELDQGNIIEIDELRKSLGRYSKKLIVFSGVSDGWNARLVRWSAAAPAVGGHWQSEHGYLPCRLFKNVSYGHLGVTNIPEFKRLFADAILADRDIPALIDSYLSLPDGVFRDMLRAQQDIVRQHTYERKFANMARALSECN